MFTNISWKEYALLIAAALFLYYTWLFFIFYAKDILRMLNKNKVSETKAENENDSEEIFGIVYQLQDEVKETIEEPPQKICKRGDHSFDQNSTGKICLRRDTFPVCSKQFYRTDV